MYVENKNKSKIWSWNFRVNFGEAMGYKYNGLWKKARSAGFSN